MTSVLSKVSKADIRPEPFPHLIVEDALDRDLYEKLAAEFPDRSFFESDELKLANNKYLVPGDRCLADKAVSPRWKEFIAYHMSSNFYREVATLFEEFLRDYYAPVEETLGKGFTDFTAGHRSKKYLVPNMANPYDVMLDCQIQCDYTFTARPFRGPHVDSPNEIYAGLLYMREPEDESEGGALGLYRAVDEVNTFPTPRKIRFDDENRAVLKSDSVELQARVPYRANTLVFFINSWRSLHSVMTRSPTVHPRRAVNIIGEICRYPTPAMFEVEWAGRTAERGGPKPSLARRALRRLRGWAS